MNMRHTEFFGPDLGRGPFSSQRIETSALQIATAIAQLRAPLSRSDADLLAHADYIRQLADRLAPDYATFLSFAIGSQTGYNIMTSFRTGFAATNVLEIWLADSIGGGPTGNPPISVTWNTGAVLQTLTTLKHWRILTPATGIAEVTVNQTLFSNYYWAVMRGGRVTYSSRMQFN